MVRAASRFLVSPVGVCRLGSLGVRLLVIGQFRVRDREVSRRGIVGLGGEFPVKPARADVRRILITDTVRHERVVRNAYKIFIGCATGSPKCEGVFTHRCFGLKPNVL